MTDCYGFRALQTKNFRTLTQFHDFDLISQFRPNFTISTNFIITTNFTKSQPNQAKLTKRRYKQWRQHLRLAESKGWLSTKPLFAHRAVSQSLRCLKSLSLLWIIDIMALDDQYHQDPRVWWPWILLPEEHLKGKAGASCSTFFSFSMLAPMP